MKIFVIFENSNKKSFVLERDGRSDPSLITCCYKNIPQECCFESAKKTRRRNFRERKFLGAKQNEAKIKSKSNEISKMVIRFDGF